MLDFEWKNLGKCLGKKQAQVIAMQFGLPDKGCTIEWLVDCNN